MQNLRGDKIMDTMEMIAKALEAVVEQRVAEKAKEVNLDSVLEFIKTADREALNNMLIAIGETSIGSNLIQDIVERKIEENEELIYKDDIDVQTVDECGLLEDCYNEYLDNACDLREVAKDIIDRL